MLTRAAILAGPHRRLSVETVELDALHSDEVLVHIRASGVCHSDLNYIEGISDLAGRRRPGGTVLGHEGAGLVEEVGEGVTYVRPGDRVVACLSKFCGACDQCLSGFPARCRSAGFVRPGRIHWQGREVFPLHGLGTYADAMIVHQNNLVHIPGDIPFEQAALLGCGVTTGLGAVFNSARVRPGGRVVVFGCGGVGLAIVAGAHIAGASTIVAVDIAESKRAAALGAGATHFFAGDAGAAVDYVRDVSGGADYSFEAVGIPVLVERCLEVLDVGGLATMVGVQPAGTVLAFPASLLRTEKRLQTSLMGSNRFRIEIPKWLAWYRQGRLPLDGMVTTLRPLEEINEAMDDLRAGTVIRTVIVST